MQREALGQGGAERSQENCSLHGEVHRGISVLLKMIWKGTLQYCSNKANARSASCAHPA